MHLSREQCVQECTKNIEGKTMCTLDNILLHENKRLWTIVCSRVHVLVSICNSAPCIMYIGVRKTVCVCALLNDLVQKNIYSRVHKSMCTGARWFAWHSAQQGLILALTFPVMHQPTNQPTNQPSHRHLWWCSTCQTGKTWKDKQLIFIKINLLQSQSHLGRNCRIN